jgi:hypothetical protein
VEENIINLNARMEIMNKFYKWKLILFLLLIATNLKGQSVDPTLPASEPYELPSKTIAFTNWYFVRPGHFDWVDSSGASVFTKKVPLRELDAEFVPLDIPMGIKLFHEKPRREIPIIKTDKEWDKWGIRPSTLLFENGIYRLWGACNSNFLDEYYCYFESKDGINWTKPELNIVEFNGNKKNNLFKKEIGISIFIDPSAPADERYKTISHGKISGDQFEKYKNSRPWSVYATELDPPDVHVMRGAVSPDGLNWKVLDEPIGFEHFDTQNIGYFDQSLKKYVFYVRGFMIGPRAAGFSYPEEKFHQYIMRRAVSRIESEQFGNLPLSEIILETTPDMDPTEQFYTNCYTTIPNSPDHHLMFPSMYKISNDETTISLYSSYNGKTWHKLPGSPIYSTQNFGEPDGGTIFAQPNLVERPDGDWILPYTAYNVPHKYPRGAYRFEPGLLVWPKGRLCGIETEGEGEFATIAFVVPGSIMKINALTHRTGYIKVEVVGMDGNPVEGYSFEDSIPIIGDYHKENVIWKNNKELKTLKDSPVILRFKMRMAKIYQLYFE